jgi:hypothetical protein
VQVRSQDHEQHTRAFLSGEEKQKVKDFISFCRAGGFLIA